MYNVVLLLEVYGLERAISQDELLQHSNSGLLPCLYSVDYTLRKRKKREATLFVIGFFLEPHHSKISCLRFEWHG